MTHAVLLAAGESKRFGSAKLLAEFEGEPLVAHAARVLLEAGLTPVVVLGAKATDVGAALPDGVHTVTNERWADGMGTSIAAGVAEVERLGGSVVVVVAADTPKVDAADLRRLVAAREEAGAQVAVADYDGVVGIPACFSAEWFPKLKELSGDRGARALLRAASAAMVSVSMPSAAVDVDRPEDLEGLR